MIGIQSVHAIQHSSCQLQNSDGLYVTTICFVFSVCDNGLLEKPQKSDINEIEGAVERKRGSGGAFTIEELFRGVGCV